MQVILVTEDILPNGAIIGNDTNFLTTYDTIPHSFQYEPYRDNKHWYRVYCDGAKVCYRKNVMHINAGVIIEEVDLTRCPHMMLTGEFINGFIPICNDKIQWNFMDENGEFLLEEWANYIGAFTEIEYAPVRYGNKWGYTDRKGKIAFIDKAEYISNFSCGYSLVKLHDEYCYYNKNLSMAFGNKVFTDATVFHNDYAGICKTFTSTDDTNKKCLKWMYINKEGNYIDNDAKYMGSENWYDECFPFENGFGKIYIKEKGYNFVDKKGHLFSKRYWFGQNGAKYLGMALRDLYKENNNQNN